MGFWDLLKPRELNEHEAWLLNEWYEDKVAKYDGASSSLDELWGNHPMQWGSTFERFIKSKAKGEVNISKSDLRKFLNSKGHSECIVNGQVRFQGLAILISGSVRSHNYST